MNALFRYSTFSTGNACRGPAHSIAIWYAGTSAMKVWYPR